MGGTQKGWLLLLLLATAVTCQRRSSGRTSSSNNLLPRSPTRQSFVGRAGRQLGQYGAGGGGGAGASGRGVQSQLGGDEEGGCEDPPEDGGNGVDFSGCEEDPETGFCCVEKTECVASVKKDPILECTHKNVEQCHYTYVTTFTPSQEEVCEENFEKTCSITFNQQAFNETVRKCYTPVEKVCNGQGDEECTTVYESSCTTKYVEKRPGKFVGDTKCEKLPTELCGAGCSFEEGPEECHDKTVVSVVEQPEEVCDLNPQKTCRYATKLVPKLMPKHECTIIPKETCLLKFTTPRQIKKPLLTKWCLDPAEPEAGESYEEENARGPVLSSGSAPQSYGAPAPEGYASPATGGYDSPVTGGGFDSPVFDPTGSYSAPDEYDSYDYDYGSPSSQASDAYSVPSAGGYDAPGPADSGYSAPTSAAGGYGAPASASGGYGAQSSAAAGYGAPTSAAGSYAAPLDESYSSPARRRSKKVRDQQERKPSQRRKAVLPKRTFSPTRGS